MPARALRYEYLASGTRRADARENATRGAHLLRPAFRTSRVSRRHRALGQPLSMPVFIPPAGVHKLVDRAASRRPRAADRAGTLFGLARASSTRRSRRARGAAKWFQATSCATALTPCRDRADALRRAFPPSLGAPRGRARTGSARRRRSRSPTTRLRPRGRPGPTAWDQNTEALLTRPRARTSRLKRACAGGRSS